MNNHSFTAEELSRIDQEILAELSNQPKMPPRLLGFILILTSALGFIASLALSLDKMTLLSDPNATLFCDINPFISCGTFLNTWQSSTFGIPNMFIGLAGFPLMAASGALYLSSTKLPAWYEWSVFLGSSFAFGFVLWLMGNALFVIKALCPWCLVVWVVVPPLFFANLSYLIERKINNLPNAAFTIFRSWLVLSLLWYLVTITTIMVVFWNQWLQLI